MSAHTMPSPVSRTESRQQRRSTEDVAELKADVQLLGVSGIAAAAMIAVAQAEMAAAITAGLTAVAIIPMWLRVRRLERPVTVTRTPGDPRRH